MPFSGASYDPETLGLLTRAFNDAWHEVQIAKPRLANDGTTRRIMALRIMLAANQGERDVERLKLLALHAIGGRGVYG